MKFYIPKDKGLRYTLLSFLALALLLAAGNAAAIYLVFNQANSTRHPDRAREGEWRDLGGYALDSEISRQARNDVRFLWFGDMMLDRNVRTKIDKNGLENLWSDLAGEENRFFMSADYIGANLEGAVTNGGEHYPPNNAYDFAFEPEWIKFLKDKYGFNVYNLANNHFSDQGRQGMEETRENLRNLNINYFGCNDKVASLNCSEDIIEKNGVRIGFAGFSAVYGSVDQAQAEEIVKDLKDKSDFVIVNYHWGVEYEHQFRKTQQEAGHGLIDAGADMIIGHHPHVVQGMEIYKGKPIFYSLGNFIFDQYFSPDTQEGLGLGFTVAKEPGKEARLNKVYLQPLVSEASRPKLREGDDKAAFLDRYAFWSQADSTLALQIKSGVIILQ